MSHRYRAALASLLLCPAVSLGAAPAAPPEWVDASRALATRLGMELKTELTRAIEQGGPVAAIAVCRDRAPAIAARLSAESGARVSRTALRVRNSRNAPDELQRAVLEQLAYQMAAGPAAATESTSGPPEAVFEIKGARGVERRYMRAIPTDALCLTCHGATLSPELKSAIAHEYPADAATGFEPGQLRGAFSVIWPATAQPGAASP